MSEFKIHTIETAPAASQAVLEAATKAYGSIPNMLGILAEAPEALKAYNELHQHFVDSSFNAEEMTVVWQSINVENNCTYCVPAHTAIAQMMQVDPALTEALRTQAPMPNEKLQVLQDTTLAIVRQRGILTDAQTERFYSVGYGPKQVLEIVLGVAQKTISNYTNHLAKTPLDDAFKAFIWEKKSAAQAPQAADA
jgi:alkylhydroperoxidase family enzyme